MRRSLLLIMLLLWLSGLPAWAGVVYKVVEAEVGSDGIQRLRVIADSFFFEPNYLIVRKDVPLELVVVEKSLVVPHDFVLKVPAAKIDIETAISTKGTIVRFTPTVVGKFPFYCSEKLLFFPSHREKGMEGILEVRP